MISFIIINYIYYTLLVSFRYDFMLTRSFLLPYRVLEDSNKIRTTRKAEKQKTNQNTRGKRNTTRHRSARQRQVNDQRQTLFSLIHGIINSINLSTLYIQFRCCSFQKRNAWQIDNEADSDLEIVSIDGKPKSPENDLFVLESSTQENSHSSETDNYEINIKILWQSKDIHRLNICKVRNQNIITYISWSYL